uniref:von Willebrand factor n=1 Tax=Laticauda laticaudata TaxID=8630 RepID=A0A8C5SRJ8_LATLA
AGYYKMTGEEHGFVVKIDTNGNILLSLVLVSSKIETASAAHYLTFDGLKYMFPGSCQYVLVQDYCEDDGAGSFRILVAKEGCGFTGETCTRRITVLFDGGEIELHGEEVNVLTPLREEGNMEILKSGRYYILILGQGRMSLTWDQNMGVTVTLKENYKDKVCGLCGNFDDVPNNDLRSSRKQIEVDPSDFGNSWKVHSQCADVRKLSQGQDLASSLCNGNVLKRVMVETSCSVLNSDLFKECKKLVDPEPYVEICTYDTCVCESVGDCACYCDAIAAYAHACAQKGAVIQWRSPTLCPQSCESMNKVEEEYQCEWRYNSCGPACPRTCQHMDPIACPVKCVEGCHPHCPAGKILDELSESCIKLEECPVCEAEGRRISDGKKIILNSENPQLCQSCHCEVRNLTCRPCDPEETVKFLTTASPDEEEEDEEEEEEEVTREYSCSKVMDLAILMDGSNKLSESDFDELKNFIISMMEKLHITQKRIRLAVLEYRTGSHIYLGLKDVKKSTKMRKIVQNIKYTGGDVASATEVLKYVLFHVFGKAPRANVARIAVLFMASKDPKRIQGIFPILKKKKIIVIPIGLGPHVSTEQIGLIERQSPENRAFLMNSVLELRQRKDEIIDYFCGLVPEVSAVLSTQRPIPTVPSVEARTYLPHGLTKVPATEMSISIEKVLEVVFLVEGSHKVGKSNFDTIKEFLIRTIQELEVGEETVYISILQYSFTITVEHSFQEHQSKEFLIKKVREMKFQGGNATNTGQALNFVSQQSFTTNRREQVPHLVYMVTANPATDTITRPPKDVHVIPIGIRPNADIQELQELSQPQAPIIIEGFNNLIKEGPDLVFKTCCSKKETCTKPMDVIFLLDGTSDVEEAQFEEMKRFVKAFMISVPGDDSHFSTQVAVLQYAKVNSLEISWNAFQEKANLLKKVDSIHQREKGPSKLGEAIDFMVQHAISEANGGRPNASKTAVVIVADTSKDAVEAAAYSARANRVSLLPIGVGTKYNAEQLNALVGPSAKDMIIKLQHFEDLSTMITLGDEFMKKLCTGKPHITSHSECIDEEGNIRPGDKWQLLDQCYSVTCLAGGHTELKSHRHLCEKMAKPTCHNNFPAVKVEETCGCRWVCPCTCMGSSTRHIVTFDGLDFKLTGNCSYTLFEDKEEGVEVILHNGACRSVTKLNCMNALEVTYQGFSVQLYDNMTVAVNGLAVIPPYNNGQLEVNIYGTIMHEVKFLQQNHMLAFTPSNNEFTLQLSPKSFASKMYGLCGVCDQNSENDLLLKNDSITHDVTGFIQDWTIWQPGRVCKERRPEVCIEHATRQCSILLSTPFYECHQVIPPNIFYATCEENNCVGEEVCEIIASYSHLCKVHGVCVDWRTPDFCAMNCPDSLIYQHCQKGCTKHCENGTNLQVCMDYPTEGCFCPPGQVFLDGTCVHEDICSQCISEDGTRHQPLETWIPSTEPCKVCMCLENRTISCAAQPCTTAKPIDCGPCEIPRLQRSSNQCCPVFECVCDLISCKLPPIPHCEDGLQLIQTNPGGCRPDYACVCKQEECKPQPTLICPPHRKRIWVKTQCCDEFRCVCSCNSSMVTCPPGYLSSSVTNDCGCTSTTCIPDKVKTKTKPSIQSLRRDFSQILYYYHYSSSHHSYHPSPSTCDCMTVTLLLVSLQFILTVSQYDLIAYLYPMIIIKCCTL